MYFSGSLVGAGATRSPCTCSSKEAETWAIFHEMVIAKDLELPCDSQNDPLVLDIE